MHSRGKEVTSRGKNKANFIIDTSKLTIGMLKKKYTKYFEGLELGVNYISSILWI